MAGMDDCGCPDDRCIGYHHEAGEPCGCVETLTQKGFESIGPDAISHLRQATETLRTTADNIDRVAEGYGPGHERFTVADIKEMTDLVEGEIKGLEANVTLDVQGAIDVAGQNLDPGEHYGAYRKG